MTHSLVFFLLNDKIVAMWKERVLAAFLLLTATTACDDIGTPVSRITPTSTPKPTPGHVEAESDWSNSGEFGCINWVNKSNYARIRIDNNALDFLPTTCPYTQIVFVDPPNPNGLDAGGVYIIHIGNAMAEASTMAPIDQDPNRDLEIKLGKVLSRNVMSVFGQSDTNTSRGGSFVEVILRTGP